MILFFSVCLFAFVVAAAAFSSRGPLPQPLGRTAGALLHKRRKRSRVWNLQRGICLEPPERGDSSFEIVIFDSLLLLDHDSTEKDSIAKVNCLWWK